MVPMKILLLEDDRRLGSVLVRGLSRSGHSVDHVSTIAEARWAIAESSHDVLVFDVMLPDGDGFSLCRELRAAGQWSPVLLLTARSAVDDRVQGLDVGADDYLVKPFAFAELEARLRALARRGFNFTNANSPFNFLPCKVIFRLPALRPARSFFSANGPDSFSIVV